MLVVKNLIIDYICIHFGKQVAMFLDLIREVTTGEIENGAETRFNCPFCGDERQKLYVQSEDPYLWHCKHCDRVGNPISFVREFYGVPFQEALGILESYDYYYNDDIKTRLNEYVDTQLTEAEQLLLLLNGKSDTTQEPESELAPVPLPNGFKFLEDNIDNKESYPYFNYLLRRNISVSEAFYYKIGYVDEGSYYNPNKDSDSRLTKSIVFTTYDSRGRLIYWSTRAITNDAYVKSLNAPVIDGYFSKRNTVFNLYGAAKTGRIIISEGILNAITTGRSGVATFGKQITDEQINLFESVNKDNPIIRFYVFLDDDAKIQALSVAKRLYEFTNNVYIVKNPYKGKDANDIGPELSEELVDKAMRYEPNSVTELEFLT